MSRETEPPVRSDQPRHPWLRVQDLLLFSGALLGVALCVNLASSALSHRLLPVALAVFEAVALVMLAAPLVAWTMYRAGIDTMPLYTSSAQSESPHQRVRWAFVSTLLVLATALLVGTTTQREVSHRALAAAKLVGTAGRQRVLSQMIAREAASPPGRRNRERLSAAIERMNAEATAVRAAIVAIDTKHSESLRELQTQLQVAESYRAPMIAAAAVLARGEPGSEGITSVVLTNADLFLPKMEGSVAALSPEMLPLDKANNRLNHHDAGDQEQQQGSE